MSITLFSLVWPLQFKPASDKWVLLALADAANDDGVTWMAVKSRRAGKLDLMRKCSLSERSVQGAIKRLVAQGFLQRAENPGRGCVYIVSSTPAVSAGVQLPILMPTPAGFAGAPADAAGKPSINPHLNIKGSACSEPVDKCSISDRVLPSGLLAWQWDAYASMRRSIGKPMQVSTCQILLSKLDDISRSGWHLGDVVERALVNGWTDFHEPVAGRSTGVRRMIDGQVIKPVGAAREDLDRIAEIDRLYNMHDRLEQRAEFFRKAERRNGAASIDEIMASLPFAKGVK